jgi:vitamin B12 transporter
MRKLHSRWLLAALSQAALSVSAVHAQSTPASVVSLSEVVVVATRSAQPVIDVVADISILDRNEIEALGASSVTGLLSSLPGIQVIDNSRIYIRGADSRMTALYIDGVRVDSQDGSNLLGGGAPWDLVPIEHVERIEILRGPASAVYGSDAMGGVIQIFTQVAQGPFKPFASFGLGSRNTQKLSAGFSGQQQAWDFGLSVAHDSSDGHDTRPDLIHSPKTESYARNSVNARLGHQLVAGQRIEISHLKSHLDYRYVPWNGGTDYTAKAQLGASGLKWLSRWSEIYDTSLTLTNAQVARQDDYPYDYKTTTQSVLFENHLKVLGGKLDFSLEQKKDSFRSAFNGSYDPAFDGMRTDDALAFGFGRSLGQHSVQINVRGDKDSRFGRHDTGGLAYGFALSKDWRATASVGTAFRAPTLEQVFGPYGSLTLRPETNHSREIGLAYKNGTSAFKAVLFQNSIADMITSSQTLTTCTATWFCYYNVGRAEIKGLTFSAQHQLAGLNIRGSLDLVDPTDVATGRDLSLRARQVASLSLEGNAGAWRLGGNARVIGQRFDNAANTKVLPGYALLGATASTPVSQGWSLFGRVENLANRKFQEVGDLAMPGRTVFLGLQWRPKS